MFRSPKSFMCIVCNLDKLEHSARAELALKMRSDLTNNAPEKIKMLHCDLQKTLPLSNYQQILHFTLQKIWLHNLRIHLIFPLKAIFIIIDLFLSNYVLQGF